MSPWPEEVTDLSSVVADASVRLRCVSSASFSLLSQEYIDA